MSRNYDFAQHLLFPNHLCYSSVEALLPGVSCLAGTVSILHLHSVTAAMFPSLFALVYFIFSTESLQPPTSLHPSNPHPCSSVSREKNLHWSCHFQLGVCQIHVCTVLSILTDRRGVWVMNLQLKGIKALPEHVNLSALHVRSPHVSSQRQTLPV